MPELRHAGFKDRLRAATIFSFATVESRLGRSYAKVFIHNLKKKGEIITLRKGWYSFKPSPYLLTVALGRAYVGLGSAAFLHGAWNQVPNVTILSPNASRRTRGGERVIAGARVVVRKISGKMYFGYERMFFDDIGEWIRVSDPEKTLIDLIYYDYPFAGEITPGLEKTVDRKKLKRHLELLKKRKVKGYKKISRRLAGLTR